jgi:hypothetical protein
MKKWLRRIRGAIGTGLTWAVGWALAGLSIGVASILLPGLPWHFYFDVFDAPVPALAVPGFVGGLVFSVVLGIVGRRRRFDELSLPRFAAWGAVGGLLLSAIPATMVGLGLATIGRDGLGVWQLTAVISGPLTLLSAASAAGSLLLARRAEKTRTSLDGGDSHELLSGADPSLSIARRASAAERRV